MLLVYLKTFGFLEASASTMIYMLFHFLLHVTKAERFDLCTDSREGAGGVWNCWYSKQKSIFRHLLGKFIVYCYELTISSNFVLRVKKLAMKGIIVSKLYWNTGLVFTRFLWPRERKLDDVNQFLMIFQEGIPLSPNKDSNWSLVDCYPCCKAKKYHCFCKTKVSPIPKTSTLLSTYLKLPKCYPLMEISRDNVI